MRLWTSVERRISGVTEEQMKDEVFCEALDLAVSYAADEWEHQQSQKGIAFIPELKPGDLVMRLDQRSDTLHIRHYACPFIRMKEGNFSGWIALVKEEIELFG